MLDEMLAEWDFPDPDSMEEMFEALVEKYGPEPSDPDEGAEGGGGDKKPAPPTGASVQQKIDAIQAPLPAQSLEKHLATTEEQEIAARRIQRIARKQIKKFFLRPGRVLREIFSFYMMQIKFDSGEQEISAL